jgi:ribosomal protein S18 acetylase RimI-like enzyme
LGSAKFTEWIRYLRMLDDYPKELELRDGQNAVLRVAQREDRTPLVLFFVGIPEEERDFLLYDVSEEENLEGWFGGPNWEEVFPIIADVGGRIMGIGFLKGFRVPWRQHVGEFWMMIHPNMRGVGLGRIIANEIFNLAAELGIEKLTCEVRAEAMAAIKILKQIGYAHEGVLTGMIKDDEGVAHDLSIMSCDVHKALSLRQNRSGQEPAEAMPVAPGASSL